jgi:predicted transcriptional regulator
MRRFSKRESEILDALYRIKQGSVGDVVEALGDGSSYEAVRTTLRVLEGKGAIAHRVEDRRFVYAPTLADTKAWRHNARRLADVFFGGSIERAALAMLKVSDADFSEDELRQLEKRVAKAEAAEAAKRKPKR